MYYVVMAETEVGIIAERIERALAVRKMSAAKLARASGVDKSTISLILANERPNTPAYIVAKLAGALLVSVDYLVGLTEDMEPKGLALGEIIIELAQVARQLTSRRQRDLLLTARAYLTANKEMAGNPDLLMDNLLDMITEAGGKASRDQLIDLLNDDDDLLGDGGTPAK